MPFLLVTRCGKIDIDMSRKKDWVKKLEELAEKQGTITYRIEGYVSDKCRNCPHVKIVRARKPVFDLYSSECPMLVLKSDSIIPADWIDKPPQLTERNG